MFIDSSVVTELSYMKFSSYNTLFCLRIYLKISYLSQYDKRINKQRYKKPPDWIREQRDDDREYTIAECLNPVEAQFALCKTLQESHKPTTALYLVV
ncbi:MAG: hypothetical protein C4291_04645 [Candidatus Dadabacteria bacterium]